MRRIPTLSVALLAAAMIVAGTGCSYLKSRDHLNQGIASYRNAKYGDAVEHFEQAIKLDPQWSDAAAVSGDLLHGPVDPRRGIAREHRVREEGQG